jgi:hypothetical protein
MKFIIELRITSSYLALRYNISFIDLERGGFGEILPEVMKFHIITEGNILSKPPSGGSIHIHDKYNIMTS